MKTTIIRGVLLACLLAVIAVCMAVPFVSEETQRGINAGLQSIFRPFFFLFLGFLLCFCIGPNCVEFWRVRRSRSECRKAFRLLYRHFNEYSLEGFETAKCRHLQQNLQSELKRHCSQYPFERHHKTIQWYMRYSRQIATTRSVA
jgi:hypothetical protein